MNVLMFTMTMLMLLATMTYARLESFRSFQISENALMSYIEKNERKAINEEAKIWYEKTVVNSQNSTLPKATPNPKGGVSKLSWSILIDVNERDQNPAKLAQVLDLSKKLILNLFANQTTVQKLIEDNPGILDRFFVSLMKAIDKEASTLKIKEIIQLASLDLKDDELHLLRYELFKDNPKPIIQNTKNQAEKTSDSYSLLNHLTHRQGKTRIFLASKTLLKSIFNQDEALVDQVIEKRNSFYREVKSGRMENDVATTQFTEFINTAYPYLNPNLFDCSVTKTDPKIYE